MEDGHYRTALISKSIGFRGEEEEEQKEEEEDRGREKGGEPHRVHLMQGR